MCVPTAARRLIAPVVACFSIRACLGVCGSRDRGDGLARLIRAVRETLARERKEKGGRGKGEGWGVKIEFGFTFWAGKLP